MSSNSNKSNKIRPQQLSNNLILNEIDNSSLQQEDFFSFGDFTKDELNIYLNKQANKNCNNLNENNLYELSNNNKNIKSNTFTPTSNIIPIANSTNNDCNPSLHGVEVPWHIENKQQINTHQHQASSSSTSSSPDSKSKKLNFEFGFTHSINTKDRKESVSNNSSSSSSYSPPPHLISSNLSESSESIKSFTSSDSSLRVTQMETQIEKPINSVVNSSDSAAAAAASEAAQQRRNKKRKPPNYYQSAEYAAILKTSDESILANSTTNTSTNNITSKNETINNESSNDLLLKQTPTTAVINTNNLVENDSNNSAKKISDLVNHHNQNNEDNSSAKLVNELKSSTKNLDNNIDKQNSNHQPQQPQQTQTQPQTVNGISNSKLTQSENVKSKQLNDKLETNIEKIQNLNLKPNNIGELTNNNTVTKISTTSVAPSSSAPPTSSQDKTNTSASSGSASKCWSSLFKNPSAATAAATTTTVVAATPSAPSTQPQPQPAQHTNKQKATNNAKPTLTSSASLPISPSTSSVSLSSTSSTNTTNNHVHLNGVTNTNHSNAMTGNASVNAISSEQASFDVLKLLGTMFKQCELKHSAPALQPRGIRNKQNWCYVNATLQALLACPPFYNLIKSIFVKIKSSNTNIKSVPCIAALGRFVSEFKTMVRVQPQHDNQSKQSNSSSNFSYKELVLGEPFEVDYFYETLANLKAELTFKTGRQEDAQEFLSFLLNRLHDEMVKCLESLNQNANTNNENNTNDHSKTNGSGNTNHLNNNQEEQQAEEDDEWKEVGKKNRAFVTRKTEFKQSPLSDIFCGQFRSALSQPGVKDKESVSLEPFFTLPLDIQSDSVRNVQQALEHFVQKEEVYGFTNQETKQEIEAFKRISFEDLPPVLILYLKCFVYDKQGGIQKLLKRIDFQIDLEINKELISQNQRSKLREKKRNYKLFAVEYHHGDKANGGHYITDVYHPGIIGWVRYDDANVKVINNAQVLKSEDKKLIPYLLYYRRADLI